MSVVKRVRKDHRIDLRATADQKSMIEQAARMKGISLTSFIMGAACDAAQQVMRDQHNFVVSDEQWKAYFDAMPPPPEGSPMPQPQQQQQQQQQMGSDSSVQGQP